MKKLIILLSILVLSACSQTIDFAKGAEAVKGFSTFVYGNNLHCEILIATNKEDEGKIITLMDLETENPRALFASGTDSPMKKIFEAESTVTIQLIAISGSVDTIVLNKESGLFARASLGDFAGVYSGAAKGACK